MKKISRSIRWSLRKAWLLLGFHFWIVFKKPVRAWWNRYHGFGPGAQPETRTHYYQRRRAMVRFICTGIQLMVWSLFIPALAFMALPNISELLLGWQAIGWVMPLVTLTALGQILAADGDHILFMGPV